MDGLGIPVTGVPFVEFAPRSIVQHQTADWSAVRADNVEVDMRRLITNSKHPLVTC